MTSTVCDKSDILLNRKIKALMTKKYPSKISYGLLSFIFLVFYAPIVPAFLRDEINSKIIGFIVFQSFVFALIVSLFLKTEYIIDKTQLIIKCGFFSYKPIDIKEIKEISKTKSIQSSPAPSFDRIEIKLREASMMPSNSDRSDALNTPCGNAPSTCASCWLFRTTSVVDLK